MTYSHLHHCLYASADFCTDGFERNTKIKRALLSLIHSSWNVNWRIFIFIPCSFLFIKVDILRVSMEKDECIKNTQTRAKAIYNLIETTDAGRSLTAPSKYRQISYCMLIVPHTIFYDVKCVIWAQCKRCSNIWNWKLCSAFQRGLLTAINVQQGGLIFIA